MFDWSAVYDDAANTLTIQANGAGRCTVVVAQSNDKQAVAFFVQPGGQPLPLPSGITADFSVTVVIGSGPLVIPNIRLKPIPDPRGSAGGFMVANEEWRRF